MHANLSQPPSSDLRNGRIHRASDRSTVRSSQQRSLWGTASRIHVVCRRTIIGHVIEGNREAEIPQKKKLRTRRLVATHQVSSATPYLFRLERPLNRRRIRWYPFCSRYATIAFAKAKRPVIPKSALILGIMETGQAGRDYRGVWFTRVCSRSD